MDRTRASSNLGAGLVIGAIALGVFALVFLISVIYIGP
jgi:hypothetical protein